MIRGMETIYDVFRALVDSSRNALPDTAVARAHEIIDAHEADAKGDTPDA